MVVICPDCKSENTEYSRVCETCGTPIEATEAHSSPVETIMSPQSPLPGEKLFAGRYQILSTLGQGGMGEVYRVLDTRLQEEMALKLLKPEIASNPTFIQRFRNELKLARKITHRNVCRVFDFHEEGGTPFITMEYVEGKDLSSLIKEKGKLKEAEVIRIAAQIAEGLAVAHDLGVVHRDLNPRNILIEPGGHAKIMDFGIARSIEEIGITQMGHIVGTPGYMSAEQASGQPVDHRSDIYALGVLLYEMTTGQLPFKGESVNSVLVQHREKAPGDPREINPEISVGLSRLILCCMEKDRECRYQSARELLAGLRSLSADAELKIAAEPKIPTKKARGGWFASWKRIAAVSAAVFILFAAIIILLLTRERNPTPVVEIERPSLAVVYFENNTGDESLAHWRKAFAELLTSDLSQSKYLKVLSGDRVFNILDDLGQLEAAGYSSDVLEQVARKGRVRHILRGSYFKAGPRFRVCTFLHDMATGKLVGSQTLEAEGEEKLFTLVDDLTRRIKSQMHLTSEQIAGDIDKEAADVLTSSPEAYRLFVEGLRHNYRGEYQRAIEFMDRAIAIDPQFASAYVWKAMSHFELSDYKEFVLALTKAYELRDRVSERERLRFTAFYYMTVENDIKKAKKELLRFVSLYPDDMYANHQLGYLYFVFFEEYQKSLEYVRRNVDNRIEMFYSYCVMSRDEMCLGNYKNAQDVLELYISEVQDHPQIRYDLSINYFCLGDYDQALAQAEKAVTPGNPRNLLMGGIRQAKGDFAAAERYYRELVGSKRVLISATGWEYLGILSLLQGRYQESESKFQQAIKLNEDAGNKTELSRLYTHLAYIALQKGNYEAGLQACDKALEYREKTGGNFNAVQLALHLKGLCHLAMGNNGAASNTARELKALSRKGPSRRDIKNWLHLAGSIEMETGNTANAITYLEEAVSLLPAQNEDDLFGFDKCLRRTIYLDSLAKAHLRVGHTDKARQVFEAMTALTIGRHHWGDLYIKAYYWLGKISEEQGKPKEAAALYRTFLELWQKADPGIPELSDARVRLESLAKE